VAWIQEPIGLQLAIHPYTKSIYGSVCGSWKTVGNFSFCDCFLALLVWQFFWFGSWKNWSWQLPVIDTYLWCGAVIFWESLLLSPPLIFGPTALKWGEGMGSRPSSLWNIFHLTGWRFACKWQKAVILVNSCQILRKIISKSPDLHDKFQENSNTSFPI